MAETDKEELRSAAQLLLDNRWIMRESQPEEYFLIRRHEKRLREFFRDRCGWPLLVTSRFYKLEKIPVAPRPFMGIAEFKQVTDYVFLACIMAFLEEYEPEGQFLLADVAESMGAYYPHEEAIKTLDWTDYGLRRSLVRTLKFLTGIGVLKVADDTSEKFVVGGYDNEGGMSGNALYEVTVMARYFLRSFPRNLAEYRDLDDFAAESYGSEFETEEIISRQTRRRRVYRKLLLEPVYYRSEENEADFNYIRLEHNSIGAALEDFFDLGLEVYRDAAMAVTSDLSPWFANVFPVRLSGLHEIILHLSAWLLAKDNDFSSGEVAAISLTRLEWERMTENLRNDCGYGWTKEYREMKTSRLAKILLEEMRDWGMAETDENGIIKILPALFRLSGAYMKE